MNSGTSSVDIKEEEEIMEKDCGVIGNNIADSAAQHRGIAQKLSFYLRQRALFIRETFTHPLGDTIYDPESLKVLERRRTDIKKEANYLLKTAVLLIKESLRHPGKGFTYDDETFKVMGRDKKLES